MVEEVQSPVQRRWFIPWVVLGVILCIAAGLRIARIHFDSLTFDEQWHVELSTGRGSPHVRAPRNEMILDAPAVTSLVNAPPWYAVWTNMDYVIHPPLYCTILRLWREAFGAGDVPARALSILCSLIAIALMFVAAWQLNGLTTAIWASLIFAVSPTQVAFAQQVRGYDMMLAWGMGAILALVRLEKSSRPLPKGPAIALGICALGMMLTHYFAIGACAAIGAYVAIRLDGAKRKSAVVALISAGLLFAIIWGPSMWAQRGFVTETADPWLKDSRPGGEHVLKTLRDAAAWPWRLTIDIARETPFPALAVVVIVAPFFMLRRCPDLWIWCLWILGTIGFITALDLARHTVHLRHVRYVSLAAPAVFVLAAGVLRGLPPIQRQVFPAIIVIFAVFNWKLAYFEREGNWRQMGALIDQHASRDETLIFYPGTNPVWVVEIFYLGAAHYSHGFPRPIIKLTAPAPMSLIRQIPGQTAWLISGPLKPVSGGGNAAAVAEVLPGATVLERHVVPNLAILTRVQLRESGFAATQ